MASRAVGEALAYVSSQAALASGDNLARASNMTCAGACNPSEALLRELSATVG